MEPSRFPMEPSRFPMEPSRPWGRPGTVRRPFSHVNGPDTPAPEAPGGARERAPGTR